ncbi:MAG TPA: carboxynorspermidine decarboxylase [Bacteroidaceae bacterium]|nr:carboxynorspermidine decarboxylase [Bacteroidaceae bacterium]
MNKISAIDNTILEQLSTPCYILEENLLIENLTLIKRVEVEADIEIILALKAFALWKTFPIFRNFFHSTTASSLNEARLSYKEFKSKTHTYSPAYTEEEFARIVKFSSKITFNSWNQFNKFYPLVRGKASCGIRINPGYSEIKTDLYNPCSAGSRFGISIENMPQQLPIGVQGFHCHNHCESNSYALERTLEQIEQKFGMWLEQIEWLNLGGGHLITHKDYNIEHLITTLKKFKQQHKNLKLILEPGSAFLWQTGPLVASVIDIVENNNIRTAILDTSFTCHMPDCLEMPYHPVVRGAKQVSTTTPCKTEFLYRLGGNSCLSGDWMGYWEFNHPLSEGDKIIFEDMNHYTTVKTSMFNGVQHPSIILLRGNGELKMLRKFKYSDYRNRMC